MGTYVGGSCWSKYSNLRSLIASLVALGEMDEARTIAQAFIAAGSNVPVDHVPRANPVAR